MVETAFECGDAEAAGESVSEMDLDVALMVTSLNGLYGYPL